MTGAVARVVVDSPLHHLDRLFDYTVPDALSAAAVPGARVRVRFAGRVVDGWLLDRVAASDSGKRLTSLHKVVSAEPVLSPEVAELCRAVADRWAGTMSDVLRLAVPPRHARVEAVASPEPTGKPGPPDAGSWDRYSGGTGFVDRLAAGEAPRAVWRALPGPHWPDELARAIQATLSSGRGALAVLPDARDVARLDSALTGLVGPGQHVVLAADDGPSARYRAWLAVRRGSVRCALGTRSAMWAPVPQLGLVACWDDGDDLHKEPRAPYPTVRDVLVLRAHQCGAAALVGGFAPSIEAEQLIARGWARPLAASRTTLRAAAPRVAVAGSDAELARDPEARAARVPTVAVEAARAALRQGQPVLVQVPRTGYQPTLACAGCRSLARCAACAGPVGRTGSGDRAGTVASCRWCGRPAADWCCPACGHGRLRAVVVGSRRTAEELGRAFPGVVVRTSDRGGVLAEVPAEPALVVATPGAEPVAAGGYGAVLLLDGGALLSRPDLRAGEEALRRWCAAAALARPAADGGRVVLMADAGPAAVQALVRWDPAGLAAREYAERTALRFPPAVRMAAVDGETEPLAGFLSVLELPATADVLGPVPFGEAERALVRVPWHASAELARALHAALAVRSARKSPGTLRVELDPLVVV